MWRSESSYQNKRARCLTNMPLAFALVQVIRKFQLLEVQVTLAVNAVSERSKAVAQLSWKLMHRWACFGVCCGSRMIVLESSEGTLHVRTNRPDRHCLSWITILDQLLLPFRLSHTTRVRREPWASAECGCEDRWRRTRDYRLDSVKLRTIEKSYYSQD